MVYYNAQPDGTISPDIQRDLTVFGIQVFSSSTTLDEWLYSFECAHSAPPAPAPHAAAELRRVNERLRRAPGGEPFTLLRGVRWP